MCDPYIFGMFIPEVEVLSLEPHKVHTMFVCNTKRDTTNWKRGTKNEKEAHEVFVEAHEVFVHMFEYVHKCVWNAYVFGVFIIFIWKVGEHIKTARKFFIYARLCEYVHSVMQMVFCQCGSRVCVTELIHMCDIPDGYSQLKKSGGAWHQMLVIVQCICVPRLMYTCDMAHVYAGHDAFTCATFWYSCA